jgi:hypothetical protein
LTVGILSNVFRAAQGKIPLTESVSFENPISAMAAYQMAHIMFHLCLKIIAAIYREFASPEGVYALVQNRLSAHSSDPRYSVSRRARRAITNDDASDDDYDDDIADEDAGVPIQRKNDAAVVQVAACLVTRLLQPGSDVPDAANWTPTVENEDALYVVSLD